MNIRMLGTGYGECKNKKRFSKEYRGRGGVLIDDTLLIDAPEDIFDTANNLGLDGIFNTVTDLLISHSHSGHFSPEAIARLSKKRKIRVHATRAVLLMIPESANIERREIEPFMTFSAGGHMVVALPTNHETAIPGESCLNFVVMREKALFYGLDGGFFSRRAFNVLKTIRLDGVILDGALEKDAPSEASLNHNDIDTVIRMKSILENAGVACERTKYIISHIPTDKKREIHAPLSQEISKYGIILAYDGYFARI